MIVWVVYTQVIIKEDLKDCNYTLVRFNIVLSINIESRDRDLTNKDCQLDFYRTIEFDYIIRQTKYVLFYA